MLAVPRRPDRARTTFDYAILPEKERWGRPVAQEIVSGAIGDAFCDQPGAKLLCRSEDRANRRTFGYVLIDLEASQPIGWQLTEKFEVRSGDWFARLVSRVSKVLRYM